MIYFFGDVHGKFTQVIQTVLDHRPEAIVLLGDIEAQQPLEHELKPILERTDIWWIPGNHDTDNQKNHDHLFCSALAQRNLHGRVVEIAGVRVAGLGGVFRGEIWYPDSQNAPVHFNSYADYQKHSEQGRIQAAAQQRTVRRGEMSEAKAQGKLLTHRSTIFYAEWLELQAQRADILVTHEAPSCHPKGFKVLDVLARALQVKTTFHGHQHDRLDYQPFWEKLGFQAHGVGLRGVTDQYGELVREGEQDVARSRSRSRSRQLKESGS